MLLEIRSQLDVELNKAEHGNCHADGFDTHDLDKQSVKTLHDSGI